MTKKATQKAPQGVVPADDSVRFTQRIARDIAEQFLTTTKDKSLAWQKHCGPGPQLECAMRLWISLTAEARQAMCGRMLGFDTLPPDFGERISEIIR